MPRHSKQESSQKSKNYFLPRDRLEDLLRNLGITVVTDTSTDLICYCPFHHNMDSPAFNISLTGPHLWRCHNGKCDSKGNVITLIMKKGYSRNEAEKMVLKGTMEVSDLLALVQQIMYDSKEAIHEGWTHVDVGSFAENDRTHGSPALKYLRGRGITESAYDHFRMGYAPSKNMLTIPVVDERDNLCGVIGREIEKKRYQYSTGLARGELIWNINNAKLYDSIILTEGALDAVYIWQAGYPNVGAVLGSAISPKQWEQLRKYFTEIVCFFDNDDAGLALTDSIIQSVKDLEVTYVKYPDRQIGERDIKDPGELSEDEIVEMIENRKSSLTLHFE